MLKYDILLIANVLIFGLVCAAYLRHRAASIFHPVTFYLTFHGLVFVFRPIIVRMFDLDLLYKAAEFNPSIGEKITAILAVNVGLLTFITVCLTFAPTPWVTRSDWQSEAVRQRLRGPFLIVAALIVPIALYSILNLWWTKAADASTMIADATTGIVVNTDNNGWFFMSQLTLVPMTAIFAWLYRFKWWSLIPFLIFFFLKAGTGGRGGFIVASAMMILLFLVEKRRNWPEWRSAVLIVLAAFAFSVIVADRGKTVRQIFVTDNAAVNAPEDRRNYFDHPDFGNLEMLEYVIYVVPKRSGTYDYFLSNLQILTEPVPGVLWKNKPVGAPIKMFNFTDYGRPYGFTISVVGAGWMALGYIGVVIQATLFGLIYAALYRRAVSANSATVYLLFYAVMISAAIVTFRDGMLLEVLRVLPFYGSPILMLWLLDRLLSTPAARRTLPTGRISPAMAMTPAKRRRLIADRYRAEHP